MADVILVQPRVGLLDSVKDKPAIPLSLITAATNLVGMYDVKLIDQRFEGWCKQLTAELRKNPLCVGVTAMIGPQIKHALEIAQLVKEQSNVPVVWGGSQASIMPHETAQHQLVDYVVQGDGEVAFKTLVDGLASNKLPLYPGVFSKNGYRVDWEQVDLNEQAPPPYHLVDVGRYLPTRFGKPTVDLETSRGCPFNCKFCYNPQLHRRKWRALTAARTVDRVTELWADYGVNSFWFIDDEFFVDLERAKTIIEFMKRMNFTWSVQGTTVHNALRMDDEFLELLSRSGCKQLNIGVESGSKLLLAELDKKVDPADVLTLTEKLGDYGIIPWYYFVVGFPSETEEDFRLTLSLITKILTVNREAKVSGIGCYTPYPCTALLVDSIAKGYVPPSKLEDYATFGVDEINTPWVLGDRPAYRRIRGAQFTSFFIDNKVRDLKPHWLIRLLSKLYKPFAIFRFNNQMFGWPLDIELGHRLKKWV